MGLSTGVHVLFQGALVFCIREQPHEAGRVSDCSALTRVFVCTLGLLLLPRREVIGRQASHAPGLWDSRFLLNKGP